MDEFRSPIGSRRLPPLAALRAFEAAARHQSFRAAADELAVTATAVSHQIRQLEQRLGVALFERQARGVVLTMEGRRLFPALREGFDLMADALAPLLRPKRRRIVTVSATPAFMARLLVPQLASFQATHRSSTCACTPPLARWISPRSRSTPRSATARARTAACTTKRCCMRASPPYAAPR